MPAPLALFDLDHTLLDGDGDDLWCRFLVRHGLADAALAQQNEQMGEAYRSGQVGVDAFSAFYARLLAGRTPAFWAPWQDRFLVEELRPRLPAAARDAVATHRAAGHLPVLTTASNSVIAARSAAELGFDHWLATDLELAQGIYTGRVLGTPNMRGGKLVRMLAWLAGQGLPADALADAWFYSDSINDLPLLGAVGHPVAANPDAMLQAHAAAHGWHTVQLLGTPQA
ncbi:HAD-IB family hydrolase [Pseudorhodoferax sp. LjRoot39]|uniref:HAD family hydrolase n=1 Tax=Pseudorhodoferax sp. LjRoot39 TaxID=3342328 RepID=UPI003ECF0EDC